MILVLMAFSALLGMAAGVLGVEFVAIWRGRTSLRVNALVVLMASCEMFLTVQEPDFLWYVLGAFALAALVMGSVDLAIVIWVDPYRQHPRLSPELRRPLLTLIGIALALIGAGPGVIFWLQFGASGGWFGCILAAAIASFFGLVALIDLGCRLE